jgi:hypothetical protein
MKDDFAKPLYISLLFFQISLQTVILLQTRKQPKRREYQTRRNKLGGDEIFLYRLHLICFIKTKLLSYRRRVEIFFICENLKET